MAGIVRLGACNVTQRRLSAIDDWPIENCGAGDEYLVIREIISHSTR